MRFEGKTIIVTGGSQGIGLAVAEGVARDGGQAVILARRADVLDGAVAQIKAAGGKAEGIVVDVVDSPAFTAAIRDVAERHGRLDGLVNNAFQSMHGDILDTTLEQWRRTFTVNVEAPFVAIQATLPIMQKQGFGSIVNIASVSGVRARPGSSAYSASKAALIHLGAIAAMEAGGHGVRVNTVIPGATASPTFKAHMAKFSDEQREQMGMNNSPMGRVAQPEEVAGAVLFFLSDEARFVTGAELRAEGGSYWRR